MRVAIVTESFPPDVNGVANSVARIVPHLVHRGHEPLVIAPRPALGTRRVADAVPAKVIRVPAVAMPSTPACGWRYLAAMWPPRWPRTGPT